MAGGSSVPRVSSSLRDQRVTQEYSPHRNGSSEQVYSCNVFKVIGNVGPNKLHDQIPTEEVGSTLCPGCIQCSIDLLTMSLLQQNTCQVPSYAMMTRNKPRYKPPHCNLLDKPDRHYSLNLSRLISKIYHSNIYLLGLL